MTTKRTCPHCGGWHANMELHVQNCVCRPRLEPSHAVIEQDRKTTAAMRDLVERQP